MTPGTVIRGVRCCRTDCKKQLLLRAVYFGVNGGLWRVPSADIYDRRDSAQPSYVRRVMTDGGTCATSSVGFSADRSCCSVRQTADDGAIEIEAVASARLGLLLGQRCREEQFDYKPLQQPPCAVAIRAERRPIGLYRSFDDCVCGRRPAALSDGHPAVGPVQFGHAGRCTIRDSISSWISMPDAIWSSFETMRTKEKRGTLLWVLDHTKTAMGGRLLRSVDGASPLLSPATKSESGFPPCSELVDKTI